MTRVEHQVLELMRFIDKDVVYSHLFEVHDSILVLLHLILDSRDFSGQIFLSLQQTFHHAAAYLATLALDDCEIFLYGIKFLLKNPLLDLRRLRNLAELVVRHDDAVIIVVLHPIEEINAFFLGEALLVGKQNPGIGICRLISPCNLGHVCFQAYDHGLVGQTETLHLMCGNAHYQRLARSHLMVAYPAAILFQHPYTILLRLINGADAISVAQRLHIEVGESLMTAVVLRPYITVELLVIKVNEVLSELGGLRGKPIAETVSNLVDLGIGKLDSVIVRHLYVIAVFISAGRFLDIRHSIV